MSRSFSSESRHEIITRLQNEPLDVLVIGGGITGAGIALDAQVRGLKVGLVEMQDFAAGTSSRSTKLIHGGLRYLKQFEFKLVSEVGKERAIVYENAPHVTTPAKMLLPVYKDGTFRKLSMSLGLKLYDTLADVPKDERRFMLSKRQTLKEEPLLRADKLKGSGMYVEYQTDDARLTIEILKEAVRRGAIAVNYVKAESLLYERGQAVGAIVVDQLTNEAFKIYAKKIINATGPWLDLLREQDRSLTDKTITLSKGVHIVVPWSKFPLRHAVYFETKTDGRLIFAIPREDKTYIGTTDTPYEGDIAKPRLTTAELDYLLAAVNHTFPSVKLQREDLESSWAGLRPLIYEKKKSTSAMSRKDEMIVSESGLISIAGGKLTGYRKMAERVVDFVCEQLGIEKQSETEQITLSGGYVGGAKGFQIFKIKKLEEGVSLGLSEKETDLLIKRYGSNVSKIFTKITAFQKKAESYRLSPSVYAQLRYGIEEEMVQTPADFFIRRTGALYFHIDWVKRWKDAVIYYMNDCFQWTEKEREKYTRELEEEIYVATHPVDG